MIYEYEGQLFPEYLKHGNAMQFFRPFADHFCKGRGVDIGCGDWPFPGAIPFELKQGKDGADLPFADLDYIVSSHCAEHLTNPWAAMRRWLECLRPGGVLALYLPHEDMTYWRPGRCAKHLHQFRPAQVADALRHMGYVNVIHSERDLAWSFAVVGFKP